MNYYKKKLSEPTDPIRNEIEKFNDLRKLLWANEKAMKKLNHKNAVKTESANMAV